MHIIRLQGEAERRRRVHYELNMSAGAIGVGGMGQVFKGLQVDERTGATRPVAIKFMFDDLPPSAYERAHREASIRLHNDNLIEMLGYVETQEAGVMGDIKKHCHVISELLEGVTLEDLLKGKTTDRYGRDVPYAVSLFHQYNSDPEQFARTIVMSVLNGLMALHNAGYIHRDIDPSNIMVTSNGHIKLIDLGLARQMSTNITSNKRGLTIAGTFMGKPKYAAPELALGNLHRQNQTTDLYSVGILLYQCITGNTPFEGPRYEVLQKQLKGKIPLTAIRNKSLRNIIAKACEKKQERRFQSAAQMRAALEEVFMPGAGEDDRVPGHSFSTKDLTNYTDYTVSRKKMLYAGGVGVVLILSIFVTLSLLKGGGKTVPQPVELKGIAAACAMMKAPATAQQGLALLTDLAEKGNDANATYLLSRLYFKSRNANDLYPDSIRTMQQTLNISINNKRAHKLLEETIALAPQNYFALYELGCDYMDGHARTDAVERELKTAKECFNKAMRYATAANDNYYMERIQQKLDAFE